MNAGLSNYSTLAGFVLPASMAATTTYQAKLLAVGNLVAGLFDVYCNRSFAWNAAAEDIFTGDRPDWYVRHYPIQINPATQNQAPAISAVNMRYFLTDNWTDILGERVQDKIVVVGRFRQSIARY